MRKQANLTKIGFVATTWLLVSVLAPPQVTQAANRLAPSQRAAGVSPISDPSVWIAFHETSGVERIVTSLGEINRADSRISELFNGVDRVRLHEQLVSHFCFILGGRCRYRGKAMGKAHEALDLTDEKFDIFIANLRSAMTKEAVDMDAQGKFVEKLESMRKLMVEKRNVADTYNHRKSFS